MAVASRKPGMTKAAMISVGASIGLLLASIRDAAVQPRHEVARRTTETAALRGAFDSVPGRASERRECRMSGAEQRRSNECRAPANQSRAEEGSCGEVRTIVVSELEEEAPAPAAADAPAPAGRTCRHALERRRVLYIDTKKSEPAHVWLEKAEAVFEAALAEALPNVAGSEQRDGAGRGLDETLIGLAGPVHAAPVYKDGTLAGLEVSGIRIGSLLSLLGLRNGDVIEAIDGRDPSASFRSLGAYARLARGKPARLAISVRRRGTPVRLEYRID